MFDPRLDRANEYPVALTAPDIRPYKTGNTGVDYVHTFVGAAPGPHVGVTAVVHGNELCGAIALDWLLRQNPRPRRGKLTLGFMNVAAYSAFDPANANLTRWLEEDFNRLWAQDVLDDSRRTLTVELQRAREVRPVIADLDVLFDIHSMQTPCAPIILSGAHAKGRRFAQAVGLPLPVLSDSGHQAGKRMRDYGDFGDPDSGKNALLIECGQNWAASSADVAINGMAQFLRHSGVMSPDFGEDALSRHALPPATMSFYQVGEIVTVGDEKFSFVEDWSGFEHLEKGTLIGNDGNRKIIAPYQPTVLIMPSRRLFPGETAVRLAYPIPPP